MRKTAFYLVLGVLSVAGLCEQKPVPVQRTKAPLVEGDELFVEEEIDLEEEDLEGFGEG